MVFLLVFSMIMACAAFQFKAPSVSLNPSTINTNAQYTIYIQRQFTQQLSNTSWNIVPVPAGSDITIQFPVEYVLSGSQVCDFVVIGSDMPTFTCSVDVANRKVSINGAINTDQFISDVSVSISNVLNPFPAISTSPFLVTIGADYSSNDPNAAVSLTPAAFNQSLINFNPATVNTTGNMVFTLTTTNRLPVGSSIVVKFPYNLQWNQDVSSSHQLQLNSTMTCSNLSSTISSSIVCSGLSSTQQVTITSLSPMQIPSMTSIKFSINNLFSPPTQNPVDVITITSMISNSSGNYQIDSSNTRITGLVAKNLPDLLISTTSSLKTINTNVGIRVTFTVQDTITSSDYFQIAFPIGTIISNTTSSSTFSLSSTFLYNSATGILTFYQTSNSVTRFTGFSAFITFLSFRTPSSTKPTDPIIFRVMKNNYAKMRGSAVFVADPKVYIFTVSTNDTAINAICSYTINFNLADALQRSGYIILTLPTQLIVLGSGLVVGMSSNSSLINTSPTVQQINSTSYYLKNLNRTVGTTSIPIQTLTLTITGLRQPNSMRTISNFFISVYLSSQNYLTAYGQQNNTISVVSGVVTNVSVTTNVSSTSAIADLSILAQLQNSVEVGGSYYIVVPSDINIQSAFTCLLTSTSNPSVIFSSVCTKNGSSSLQIQISVLIPAQSLVTLKISPVKTPISTMTTSSFAITTTNANNLTIDRLLTNITLTMTQPAQLSLISITRSSSTNYQTAQFYLELQSIQNFFSNGSITNFAYIEFPTQISVLNLSSVIVRVNNSSTLSYNIISSSPAFKISISLPPTLVNLTGNILGISGLTNPASLKSTTTGILINLGFNRTQSGATVSYLYATGLSLSIQNSIVSDFTYLTFSYNRGVLFSETNLTISLGLIAANRVFSLQLQLDTSLKFKDNTSLSLCSSSQISLVCTVTSISPSIVKITPQSVSTPFSVANLTLNIGPILTPTSFSSNYPASALTTFDSSNFAISRNISYIKYVASCQIPCRQCVANQPTQCTVCFLSTQNITNQVYYVATPNQTYGQCLSSCPSGYYVNGSSSYTCLKCNSNCLQCLGQDTNCSSCPTGNYLLSGNNTCVSVCPNGTYGSVSNSSNLCVTCPTGCSLCNSNTSCSKCSSGYFLYNNACSTSCPANTTISNSSTQTCDICSSLCLTCQGTTTNCTSCSSTLVLNNGSCLSQCSNISMIPINGTCTLCSTVCLTCSITLNNCTSCASNTTNKYLYNGTCVSSCPSTFYYTSSNICVSCSNLNIGCLNCSSNGQSCLSCDLGFVYFNNTQCLNYTPNGYINISGIATPCQPTCLTCSVTVANCTSCKTSLLFYLNTCISSCPNSTVNVNGTCVSCNPTCTLCSGSINYCLACQPNYFLNSITHQCVDNSGCPNYTYPNSTTSSCSQCVSPCLQCTSQVGCSSCVRGFYFQSVTSLCLDVCPLGYVGVVDICLPCISPCRHCQIDQNTCILCVSGYYLNTFTHQCLLQCPAQVTISNPITMTCDLCTNNCLTCVNLTSQCTSCVSQYFLIGRQCLKVCPPGYYGQVSSLKCQNCSSSCKTCSSSPSQCTSCFSGLYLYNLSCVTTCPVTYGIIDSNGNCVQCKLVLANCLTCNSLRQCLYCVEPAILLNGACYTQCPQGYILKNQQCITGDQNAQQILANTLTSSSVFPMPFTCVGFSIFIAFLMSKLQNKNTYLIGSAYALSGLLQTTSLIYLVIKLMNSQSPLQATTNEASVVNQFPLISVGLIIIFSINVIGLLVQTPLLCSDTKFQSWLKNSFHKFLFILVTILSFLLNYKLKLIMFSKLFSFTSTRSQLESVQKFRVFNVLSFLGVSHQIFVIYVSVVMLTKQSSSFINNQMFLIFIDTAAVTFVAILLSILSNKKDDDFFVQLADNGYVLNKKITIQGDDLGKQGLQTKFLKGQQNKHGKTGKQMDSFQKMINQDHQEIYEDEEISLSISENRSQIDRRQRRNKAKQRNSQLLSDNEINQYKNRNGKLKNNDNIQSKNMLSNDEYSSNPIKKQLVNSRQKDQMFNSVIFQRQKQYEEQQVKSKNQSVLIESSQKSRVKQNIQQQILANKTEKNSNTQALNIENIVTNNQKLQDNKNKNQVQSKNEKSLNPNINQQTKQKERQKEIKIPNTKKGNKTKIFKQEKNINKQDQCDEQIKRKIALKVKQLQGLKKQTSEKELRRSREKQKNRSYKNQPMLFEQQKQTNKDIENEYEKKQNMDDIKNGNTNYKNELQKQKEGKTNNFFQQQLNIQQINNGQNQLIQENDSIKQELQNSKQKENYLKQQKQQQKLRQQANLSALTKSRFQPKDILRSGGILKLGTNIQQQKNTKLKHLDNQNDNSVKQDSLIEVNTSSKFSQMKKSNQNVNEFAQNGRQQNFSRTSQQQNNFIKQQQPQRRKQNQSANSSPQTKSHKSKNIQNMYDSVLKLDQMQQSKRMQQSMKKSKNNQNQANKEGQYDYVQQLQENISDEQVQQYQVNNNMNKANKGKQDRKKDIGIGQSLQNMLQCKNDDNKTQNKNRYGQNIFSFEDQPHELQDSGLQDSQPYMDQQINHHPMKSSFATDRRSVDITKTDDNSGKHPLIGILQTGQQVLSNRHPIPRMKDETQTISNREDEVQTKLNKYNGNKPNQQKTQRKVPEKPPLQRPSTNQKNRIYAAGLRQFQDQTLNQKSSFDHPINEKPSKISIQGSSEQILLRKEQKKRNRSLYQVNLKKLQSKQSKDNSSDHTQQMIIKPGYFMQNSSQQIDFTNPKYTSTMLVDNINQIPQKPKVGQSARGSHNRTSTSQQKGGRKKIDGNTTTGQRMFTKKQSIQFENQVEEEDELDDFYRKRQSKLRRSPKRQRSKQRKQSKQSVKRMKQIEKVYLQRLQPPPQKKK